MTKNKKAILVLSALLFGALAAPTNAANAVTNHTKKYYVVEFSAGTTTAAGEARMKALGANVRRTFNFALHGASIKATPALAQRLAVDNAVAVIEQEKYYGSFDVPGQWGQDRMDQASLPLDGSYSYTSDGSGVTLYVVDTGIRYTHAQFNGRVLTGANFVNDGQTDASDCDGHGTHVSGIAGGITYGIAKHLTLVPVRVLNCRGSGTTSTVVAGLDYVASQLTPGALAVVNMSLGGGRSTILDNAVKRVIDAGATVVVAAGNSSNDACKYSPADVPAAITVAASDATDHLASYSNYGSCVDLIAPGSNIRSATNVSDTSYANWSGTSMASPQVAGAAARLLQSGYQSPANLASALVTYAQQGKISMKQRPARTTANLLLYLPPAV